MRKRIEQLEEDLRRAIEREVPDIDWFLITVAAFVGVGFTLAIGMALLWLGYI